MTAHSELVYLEGSFFTAQSSAAAAKAIMRAAENSLAASQFDVRLRPLSADDIRRLVAEMPSGHERLCQDTHLVLMDAGAMLAYAPYRSRILLLDDPFDTVPAINESIGLALEKSLVRVHDALIEAATVIALGNSAFTAAAPLVRKVPERRAIPPAALTAGERASGAFLVVNNEDERALGDTLSALTETWPQEVFLVWDSATPTQTALKAMIQIGIARLSAPGARLSDAWAGGVPVFQVADPLLVDATRRRATNDFAAMVVDHGRTGILLPTTETLVASIADFMLDPLPARAVARAAKRSVDPAAEWDTLLKAIFQ